MNWKELIKAESAKPYFKTLNDKVREERKIYNVYPENADVFNAFKLTPLEDVKVVILGQDPYHTAGCAHGLSFSVRKGVKIPPSLRNIYKELKTDVDFVAPDHGDLTAWATQGVLLLNASLTVREGDPNSHSSFGWSEFTDVIIKTISCYREDVVFMLWGAFAQEKGKVIDPVAHKVLKCAHPSPFSADRGFYGCKHFSQANQALQELGKTPINWQL